MESTRPTETLIQQVNLAKALLYWLKLAVDNHKQSRLLCSIAVVLNLQGVLALHLDLLLRKFNK